MERQTQNADVSLGSSPFSRDGKCGTAVVARGSDPVRLQGIKADLEAIMRQAGVEPLPDPA